MKLGVWGYGQHAARRVIPAAQESTNVELIAVMSGRSEARREIRDKIGVSAPASIDEFLALNLDAVYVCSATADHFDMARVAVSRGLSVWCEKPMTESASATLELVELAHESDVVVFEAAMYLHHPQWKLLQQLVVSGRLGRLVAVDARFGFPHLDETNFRYNSDRGGGALLDAGFYPVSALAELIPGGQVIGSVMHSSATHDVDVGGTALISDGEVSGTALWGFGRRYANDLRLWFEDATVFVDFAFSKAPDLETAISVHPQSAPTERIVIEAADHFLLMLDDFARWTRQRNVAAARKAIDRATMLDAVRSSSTDAVRVPREHPRGSGDTR